MYTSVSTTGVNKLFYSIGIGLGVTILSGGLSYWYYKYCQKNNIPSKWRRVGILKELFIFPIKSCGAVHLSDANVEVTCDILGMSFNGIRDRSLMLVDDNNQLVTARTYPKLVLVNIQIVGTKKLLISATNMADLEIDFETLGTTEVTAPTKDIHTAVFGSKVDAMLCGVKYDEWFSQYVLGKDSGLHLVYFSHPVPVRPINSDVIKEPFMTRQDTGTFGDATSYMLMNLSSIADLNQRLAQPVYPIQFRGNFYLQMDVDEPYAEDKWYWFKIGDIAVFRHVAPCIRCILPNINPMTGERDENGEPLKTLKSYRKWPNYNNPPLGTQLGVRRNGTIKVGDVIHVEDK